MELSDKYHVPNNENSSDVLPNLLGLSVKAETDKAEAMGFANAEIKLINTLTDETVFDVTYITAIHRFALEQLYSFAGKYRTVNLSKGGFAFPAAKFLNESMDAFNKDVLLKLPNKYESSKLLIKDIAKVHAELLFIHPFREGNGRTARLLADLMVYKAGYNRLKFEKLNSEKMMKEYILGVQKSAEMDYSFMEKIISFVFEI